MRASMPGWAWVLAVPLSAVSVKFKPELSLSAGGGGGYTESGARAAGFNVTTRNALYPGELAELSILRDGFDAEGKLVIDADRDTLLGATFVGPDVAELVQAATVAVVGEVPLSVLRHVVAPHPSLSQVWNPLLVAS